MAVSLAFAPSVPLCPSHHVLPTFTSTAQACRTIDRDRPIPALYPQRLTANWQGLQAALPGRMHYAVKANPHPAILDHLARLGCRYFDVASVAEMEAVRKACPTAVMALMHPVKSRTTLRHALRFGISMLVLDCAEELNKIAQEYGSLSGLTLMVRLAVANQGAAFALEDKFGATPDEAVELLKTIKNRGAKVGLTFHVGSQCMRPADYADAIALARQVADRAGVSVDVLDVGGGFPVAYPGMEPPAWADYGAVIQEAVARHGFAKTHLVTEPGRALVASAGSLLVKVELRKGDRLYINDGSYGGLFDAGRQVRWPFPVSRVGQQTDAPFQEFRFYGPTCDSLDAMDGPFLLPADMAEGDWIEVQHLGAYGETLRTSFNGFLAEDLVAIDPRSARTNLNIAAE